MTSNPTNPTSPPVPRNQAERATQQRIVRLLQGPPFGYTYLGNWQDQPRTSPIEAERLRAWLQRQGHPLAAIEHALHQLSRATNVGGTRLLSAANAELYELLRYGITYKPDAGKQSRSIALIDWKQVGNNDFTFAEEVTVTTSAQHTKRPDLVLYINGIACAIIELKRSSIDVMEGVHQHLDNQRMEFIAPFYSTAQLLIAGNESQGVRYGVVGTPAKHWLQWHEEQPRPYHPRDPLDRDLYSLCEKTRLLDLIYNFTVFDQGTRKTCRYNQYFAVKAAQQRIAQQQGGIIWHTQGSGKTLTMVWLAQWIETTFSDTRLLIVTDRTELDQQIEGVFRGVGLQITRTRSIAELHQLLDQPTPTMLCALIHKFGSSSSADVDTTLSELVHARTKPYGKFIVFIDECHRTQSGKLHASLRQLLPDTTILIGFTGTPLLKQDKRSIEVFGGYIHTYKFDQAVTDGVVLDLRYEARSIDQQLDSPERVNEWFERKTAGLTPLAKAQLKQRWGTLQRILSTRERIDRIVTDIVTDMDTVPRLSSGHGNALLVAQSIYSACRFYERFQSTPLKGKCAIITSYRPTIDKIKGESTGEGETEAIEQYATYRQMIAHFCAVSEDAAATKIDDFEALVKERFIKHPSEMKLLIVVDRLLTGFDAPPATYLYIDKPMRDHTLFQAICRVNRLDGESKPYGIIIDYRDLFRSLEQSVKDYTSEAFADFDGADVAGLLKDRVQQGRKRLAEALESVRALCEPVLPPREQMDFIRYFCGDPSNPADLAQREPQRLRLYQDVARLSRAYTALAPDLAQAGYTASEIDQLAAEVRAFDDLRNAIKLASGDTIDLKAYEPDMRRVLDDYIRAKSSTQLDALSDESLLDLIGSEGEAALNRLPDSISRNSAAVAETIVNNVRRLITDERPLNPKYYDQLATLLNDLIEAQRRERNDYTEYLQRLVELARNAKTGTSTDYPPSISTAGQRALYDNLSENVELVTALDETIRATRKADWRGHQQKERELSKVIHEVLATYAYDTSQAQVEAVLDIVRGHREY